MYSVYLAFPGAAYFSPFFVVLHCFGANGIRSQSINW